MEGIYCARGTPNKSERFLNVSSVSLNCLKKRLLEKGRSRRCYTFGNKEGRLITRTKILDTYVNVVIKVRLRKRNIYVELIPVSGASQLSVSVLALGGLLVTAVLIKAF